MDTEITMSDVRVEADATDLRIDSFSLFGSQPEGFVSWCGWCRVPSIGAAE